jgi:hypothetical protein
MTLLGADDCKVRWSFGVGTEMHGLTFKSGSGAVR